MLKEKGRKVTPGQVPNTGQRKERFSVLVIIQRGHGIMGKIWVGRAYSSRNLAPPRKKKGNHDISIPPHPDIYYIGVSTWFYSVTDGSSFYCITTTFSQPLSEILLVWPCYTNGLSESVRFTFTEAHFLNNDPIST